MSPLAGFNATFEGGINKASGIQKIPSNFLITTLEGGKFDKVASPKPTVLAPRSNHRQIKKGIAFGSAL
jgi:hypothetical protein